MENSRPSRLLSAGAGKFFILDPESGCGAHPGSPQRPHALTGRGNPDSFPGMRPEVFCLGAINLDLTFRVDDLDGLLKRWGTGLARGGQEALSRAEEHRLRELLARFARPAGRTRGGQAANTAYALARLGIPVALAGRLGADADGSFLRASLEGVDLEHVLQQGDSGRAYILVDPEGERTILVAPNANDQLEERDLPREALQEARFLHLTSFGGDAPLELQRLLAVSLQEGPRFTLDPGELYARRGRTALEELLDRVETLLLTEVEWALLGGELTRHPVWAPPVVLIKRGLRGARLLTPVRYLDIPPQFEGRPVDTMGAGDVFAAGYLAGLLSGLSLPQAARLAEAAAAYKSGGDRGESYPDRQILERIIARLS
ncbi:MAG: carbohydrate kinase family protein [Desulfobaccales bacterium]